MRLPAASHVLLRGVELGTRWHRFSEVLRIAVAAVVPVLLAQPSVAVRPPLFDTPLENPFRFSSVGLYAAPALVDIDADGDLDAFVGANGGDIYFFRNIGISSAPVFGDPVINPFGLTNLGESDVIPTFFDLDDDGDLDGLFAGPGLATLYVENTGSATDPAFAVAVTGPFGLTGTGSLDAAPALVDLDDDGDLDVFLVGVAGDVSFYQNIGSASAPQFGVPTVNSFGLQGLVHHASPAFADLDGDGDADAFFGKADGNIVLFENTGIASSPAFAEPMTNPMGLVDLGDWATPTFADIDGDGDLDAFVGTKTGSTFFFRNSQIPLPLPIFLPPTVDPFGLTDVGDSAAPTFVDIDGDGDFDVFVGNVEGNVLFFRNTGTDTSPTYGVPTTNPFGLSDVGLQAKPTFGDFDGDGDIDALVGAFDGRMMFFQNIGTPHNPIFAPPAADPYGLSDIGASAAPTLTDVDGDGDLDVLAGDSNGNVRYFQNIGSATAPALSLTNPGLTDVGFAAAPANGDIDADGAADVISGNSTGDLVFWRNTNTATTPVFSTAVTTPFGLLNVGYQSTPTLVDIDGDGDLDVFVGDADGDTVFFESATRQRIFADGFESEDTTVWSATIPE